MNLHTHFLFPVAISLLFYKLNFLSWPLVLASGLVGMLIDLDHYLEHILHAKKNRFSIIATWNNSIKLHRFNQRSFIHDGPGILIITAVLLICSYFYWRLALALAIGYYSHILLDHLHLKKEKYFRGKLGAYFLKESYFEIWLDLLLIITIGVLVLG